MNPPPLAYARGWVPKVVTATVTATAK